MFVMTMGIVTFAFFAARAVQVVRCDEDFNFEMDQILS